MTQPLYAYVGTRTTRERNARGEGISVYRVDPATGALDRVHLVGDLVNPSFLTLNRAGDRLYTVHGDGSEVSAFTVDRQTGALTFLNRMDTGGRNLVHLALGPKGGHLVVSSHLTGEVLVLTVEADGRLGAVTHREAMPGEPGPHRKEQPFAKPHFNPFDPSGRFVVVPDKGLDKTFVFRFENGQLTPAAFPEAQGREASGPRHLAFHPSKPWAYIANELDSTVTACRFDAATGQITPFQIVSGLSDSYTGNSRNSEIEVHPSGKALYVSNRGEDTIAVLAIEQDSGRVRLIQSMPCGGKTPRFFALMPGGRFMHVLNEDSDSIVTLAVDAQLGILTHTGQSQRCGSPVCMVFSHG